MGEYMAAIPPPTKKILDFLRWAVGAASQEFDNYEGYDEAMAWLDKLEKVIPDDVR